MTVEDSRPHAKHVRSACRSASPASRRPLPGHPAVSIPSLGLVGGARGVIYGVYELLERLGCRFFTPLGEQIPLWFGEGLELL